MSGQLGTSDDPEAAHDHSGRVVTALLAVALGELAGVAAIAVALGMSPLGAVVTGVVVCLTVSTVAALAFGAVLGLRRSAPQPEQEPAACSIPAPLSPARRDALELVESCESLLLRAVELAAPEPELMACALDLQGARLRLARVILSEDGELPQPLQDELLVAHRGTSAWLRSHHLP